MKHFADHASRRQWVLSSLFICLFCSLFAQDIAIGTWRTHFSYLDAKFLTITPEKIFCASENGFFSRIITTGETRKLSKIDGLSDTGISALAYDESQNVLVIGYRSGFIDFVFEEKILSIADLANSNLDIDKTINGIAFGADRTYLATDIGILVVKTSTAEIKENFVNIGEGGKSVVVLEIVLGDDELFIRTSEGIQSGQLNKNLLDFSNWERYPGSSEYSNLIAVSDELFATFQANLLQFSTDWNDTGIDLPLTANKLFAIEESLITADMSGNIYQLNNSSFEIITSSEEGSINDITSDGSLLYFAHSDKGLLDQNGNILSPDGPVSDTFSNFKLIDNDLYGFHAPSPFSYDGSVRHLEFSVFKNGSWESKSIDGFYNVSDVASFNGNIYFSSIGAGLYDESASEIMTDIPNSSPDLDTVISSLASGENLWVSSFENEDPIHLFSEENEWNSFSNDLLFDNEFLTIDLSETGLGWLGSSSGFITVLDPLDQNVEVLNTADGLPSSFIDIDIGVDDNAWVATPRGPAVFPDASFIFFNSEAIRPTFENRILFENEAINAVMTDGGNRIWFGTNNGIWVYDENTSEQIAVFDEKNSPLPSNRIIQLAYNRRNGEVFIYTDEGMVSFRSSSSIGSRNHRSVNIFPNPVRPDYLGLVGLTGLARNAKVKVTDINGNLVKELDANGGTASWDLQDMRGGTINTGVYLFFSASSDGEETYIGKIAVIR
ncbi:hypothetical protein [Ekhidna sp.]|uniref:type IX secretion system anionic LPS delivery protein PorZ n=1 Tax=Ekhidna sp. TaxID=2608089 RepID=UPI003B5063A6